MLAGGEFRHQRHSVDQDYECVLRAGFLQRMREVPLRAFRRNVFESGQRNHRTPLYGNAHGDDPKYRAFPDRPDLLGCGGFADRQIQICAGPRHREALQSVWQLAGFDALAEEGAFGIIQGKLPGYIKSELLPQYLPDVEVGTKCGVSPKAT